MLFQIGWSDAEGRSLWLFEVRNIPLVWLLLLTYLVQIRYQEHVVDLCIKIYSAETGVCQILVQSKQSALHHLQTPRVIQLIHACCKNVDVCDQSVPQPRKKAICSRPSKSLMTAITSQLGDPPWYGSLTCGSSGFESFCWFECRNLPRVGIICYIRRIMP